MPPELTPIRLAVLAALWALMLAAGSTQWYLLHRATRACRPLTAARPFARGFALWHLGMLRRDWLPPDGQRYHRWIVTSYTLGMLALATSFVLLVVWLIA